MTIKITVKNLTNGSTIRVEVESSDTISEIIESAAEFWRLKEGAYVPRARPVPTARGAAPPR